MLQASQQFRPHWVETTTVGGPQVVIGSPAGRVLVGAIGQAIGAALEQAAYRSSRRGVDGWFPSIPTGGVSIPSPPSAPSSWSSPGGFTSGEGF
jgi:hypothetical protein